MVKGMFMWELGPRGKSQRQHAFASHPWRRGVACQWGQAHANFFFGVWVTHSSISGLNRAGSRVASGTATHRSCADNGGDLRSGTQDRDLECR